ncbi:MAG: hypothetical protein CVV27_10815, partial [Candidatus Melainabacteria bacterium HGW-Melainabacteria-1]
MNILYGPFAAKGLQPFDRCIAPDWHINSSGQVNKNVPNPSLISFELSDATHLLQTQILPHLPPGWQPDLLLFVIPERYLIPLDLHLMPCPLVVLVEDWYFNFEMLKAHQALFDYWLVDHTAVPLFRQAGIERVHGFQVFALDLERFGGYADVEVRYDIGFIGNLRTTVHTRRAHYLARLAALSEDWRVGIATERYGEDYIRFFRQCHLIFNYSIHGEFNMRCYEALGCGRLMLLEAQNQEAPLFLIPGEDYVSYRPEQLEQLIAYYLHHPQERERIALNGRRAIQRYGARQLWAELKALLAAGLASGEIRAQEHRILRQGQLQNLIWSVGPPFNQLTVAGDLIQQELNQGLDPRLLSDLAVLHYIYWLTEGLPADSASLAQATSLLEKALAHTPMHPIAAFNQGQVRALQQRFAEALESFLRCIAQLEQSTAADWPWGLVAYHSLHRAFEKFFHPWYMRQSQLQYSHTDPEQLAAARRKLLLAHAYRHAGDLQLTLGQAEVAYQSWQRALRLGRGGLGDLLPNLMRLCLDLKRPEQALEAWASGFGDPLAPELWLMHCWALAAAGQVQAAQAWYWRYSQIKQGFLESLAQIWQQLFEGFAEAPDPRAVATWRQSRLALVPEVLWPAAGNSDFWLFGWCGLSWRLRLPEPPARFGAALGVDSESDSLSRPGVHFHYHLQLVDPSGAEPLLSASRSLQRVYHTRTDLAQGLLGIDLLPCSFPAEPAEPLAQLEDCQGPLYVMLLEDNWRLPL